MTHKITVALELDARAADDNDKWRLEDRKWVQIVDGAFELLLAPGFRNVLSLMKGAAHRRELIEQSRIIREYSLNVPS